jgi:uncharacterized protein YsxB (DUF464 family)
MIRINMNTIRFKLTVEGHAMPEESEDYSIICAGASMLVQALVYSIEKFNSGGDALSSMKYRDDPGNVLLEVHPEEWARISIAKRFNYYGDGLELLAMNNPECVEFIWDGEKIIPYKEDDKK